MNYWLLTDLHFGHEKMFKLWGRPEGYEDKILSYGSSMIKKEDILICLGDMFHGNDAEWMEKLMRIKPFKMWMIRGNHDKKSYSWYITKGFDVACESMALEIYGKRVLLSHIPIQDFGQYDINIHGHFHDIPHHFHEPELVAIKNDKQYLLSMENAKYQPLSMKRIVEQMCARLKNIV